MCTLGADQLLYLDRTGNNSYTTLGYANQCLVFSLGVKCQVHAQSHND